MSAKRQSETVQSVQRCLDLLEAVAAVDTPVGVSSLARDVGLSKATTYRLCQTLVDRHFLDQDSHTGAYQPGGRLLKMTSRLMGRIRLSRVVRPVLEQMASRGGQNAFAAVLLEGRELLVCEEVRVDNPIQPRPLLGLRANLLDAPGGLLCIAARQKVDPRRAVRDLQRTFHLPEGVTPEQWVRRVVALRGAAWWVQTDVPHPNVVAVCSVLVDRNRQVVGVLGFCYPMLPAEPVDAARLGAICSEAAGQLSGGVTP